MHTSQQSNLKPFNLYAGLTFALMAAIGFSAKSIFVKLAYPEGITALPLLALRMIFSAPFFVFAAIYEARKNSVRLIAKDYSAIFILGILGYYASSLLDFMGLQYISAGLERLILFLYPTFVVLISAVVFKKAIELKQIIALVLCYIGISIVFLHETMTQNPNLLVGSSLVLLSALSYSCYLIGAGGMIQRIGSFRFTAYAMLVACVAMLLQFAASHEFSELFTYSQKVYQLSMLMAILSTVLPIFMLSIAIKKIGSGNTSIIGSIGPVVTILMGTYYLNEPITIFQIIGSFLVLVGVFIVGAKSKK
jgi:drug/metabolite transporter (DMT)-like permease